MLLRQPPDPVVAIAGTPLVQFPPQFRTTGTTDLMDTPDGTILGDTYMPDAMDGMDSILI